MTENKIFTVAIAQLDTVWRWNLAKTVDEYLPDTLEKNFALIEKYPHYRFNFAGAFHYALIEEYYPPAFEMLRQYVQAARWCPAGTAYETGDTVLPSPEALFRNFLYGNRYFQATFGKKNTDILLPAGAGFNHALPAVAHHAHLKGVTVQQAEDTDRSLPFHIGLLRGVDGHNVFACQQPFFYHFDGTVRGDMQIISQLAKNGLTYQLPWADCFYGNGKQGGAPEENSVRTVQNSIEKNAAQTNTQVIAAETSAVFNELAALSEKQTVVLPLETHELLPRHRSATYTSRAMSKRLNAQNEIMADRCERACVTADLLTAYTYPKAIIEAAWKRVLQHHAYHDIAGTATMQVYNESWNDYTVSLKQFQAEYEGAIGAIANELDTAWCRECALVVHNPAAFDRRETVEAHIKLTHNAKHITVVNQDGEEMPSQIVKKQGKEFDILFTAAVPSCGVCVYDVRAADTAYAGKHDLKITLHTLENKHFRVVLNRNGDIASIIDKRLGMQLLSAPIKLALLRDIGALDQPGAVLRKDEIDAPPYAYAHTPAFEITENGAARIALKVSRTLEHSKVEQIISLEAEGDIIRVENFIDWQERRALLKAQFPLCCANGNAAYDLGLGYVLRGNNNEQNDEVPAQKWADITDRNNTFGVSILSDCKYGWDKPSDSMLRLTCLHTPSGAFSKESRQDLQDIGRNHFAFGIVAHKGNLLTDTQIKSESFLKKLTTFQTTARHHGNLTDAFSLLRINANNITLRAVKQAEDGNGIILRLHENAGTEHTEAILTFFDDIVQAEEVYASEEYKSKAILKEGKLHIALKPFEIKSFRVQLRPQEKVLQENCKKIELPYNTSGITADTDKVNVILQGSGCSLPDELLPDCACIKGVPFRLPHVEMTQHLLIPRGQQIPLPKDMTTLYLLAASTLGDREITVLTDNKERHLKISALTEPVALWDMAGLEQQASIKKDTIGLELTHTHHPEGNLANRKAYFFLYELNIRHCQTLTLPEENRVVILAMTAVKKRSITQQVTQLTDTAQEDFQFASVPLKEKLMEKADFLTIRAGKIQKQQKQDKGKGFKKNNIFSSIIRSYTEDE